MVYDFFHRFGSYQHFFFYLIADSGIGLEGVVMEPPITIASQTGFNICEFDMCLVRVGV